MLQKINDYLKSIDDLEGIISHSVDHLQKNKAVGQAKKEDFDKVFLENKESVRLAINSGKETGFFNKLKKQLLFSNN